MLGRDFEQIFYQIVFIRMKTLSYRSRARVLNPGKKYGLFCRLHFPQRHKILNLLSLRIEQGLEGYSRDPGFDQNTVRDSGKRKIS